MRRYVHPSHFWWMAWLGYFVVGFLFLKTCSHAQVLLVITESAFDFFVGFAVAV